MEKRGVQEGGGMTKPFAYCKHDGGRGWDAVWLECIYAYNDLFDPSGKCATCANDQRKHAIRARCVDYDKYRAKVETNRKGADG